MTGVPARRSKSRTPEPRRTAAMSTWISSRSPAFRHCWMVLAPWTPTDFPAAAVLAWFTALSMPSITKCTVELGRGHPAGTWWVSTNAGPQAWFPPQPCATSKVLGARPGHLERHGVRPSGVDFDVARVDVPVEHFGHAIVEVGDVAVERHGHDCDNLRHACSFRGMETAFRRSHGYYERGSVVGDLSGA